MEWRLKWRRSLSTNRPRPEHPQPDRGFSTSRATRQVRLISSTTRGLTFSWGLAEPVRLVRKASLVRTVKTAPRVIRALLVELALMERPELREQPEQPGRPEPPDLTVLTVRTAYAAPKVRQVQPELVLPERQDRQGQQSSSSMKPKTEMMEHPVQPESLALTEPSALRDHQDRLCSFLIPVRMEILDHLDRPELAAAYPPS